MRTTSKHRALFPGARVQLNSLLTRSGRFSYRALIERPLIRTADPNLSRPQRKGAEDNQSRSCHPNGSVPGLKAPAWIETSWVSDHAALARWLRERSVGRCKSGGPSHRHHQKPFTSKLRQALEICLTPLTFFTPIFVNDQHHANKSASRPGVQSSNSAGSL